MKGFARGAGAALGAAPLLAVHEWVVALAVSREPVGWATALRFAALDFVLMMVFAVLAAPLLGLGFVAAESVLFRRDSAAAPGAVHDPVAWIWALAVALPAYVTSSYRFTSWMQMRFKEPDLSLLASTFAQFVFFGVVVALGVVVGGGVRALGRKLAPRLKEANPFSRPVPALVVLALLGLGPLTLFFRAFPALRGVVPWRLVSAALVFGAGAVAAAWWLDRREHFWPGGARHRRIAQWATVLLGVALAIPTLWVWGAGAEVRYLAMTSSPAVSRMIELVRWANDFDGDGYGSLLGENDCAPFDPKIHPNAVDSPDDGIDQNCNGNDFQVVGVATQSGAPMPLPRAFSRDYNFLLVTVDALRFDHTGFGGYAKRRGRRTTPNLDALAGRGVSFRFANAPAAGTMASVPAILASRFFHSGMALAPGGPAMPPKVLPENVLLAEVMKRGGYRTGAILTHEYFNDWGLDQGFDTFDNELGATPDPARVTSQDVTRKAEAWIAQRGSTKWFLWCHYLDPHGKYVAHPGEVRFGDSEEDLYDGEIAYTDRYIGELLAQLAHTEAGSRTVVIVTSDHGEGFMEHGFINHGMTLYRELIHVPLIIDVPNGEPHEVDGAVSSLDIFPTMASLAGIDVSDLHLEGETLVPELFYGRDAEQRVVFAETNYPNNDWQRAAVSQDDKLILHTMSDLYELYDLRVDPEERHNVWTEEGHRAAGARLRAQLAAWMDRTSSTAGSSRR